MNSYDFFIYEIICFMNSYMNSGVPRFQIATATHPSHLFFQAESCRPRLGRLPRSGQLLIIHFRVSGSRHRRPAAARACGLTATNLMSVSGVRSASPRRRGAATTHWQPEATSSVSLSQASGLEVVGLGHYDPSTARQREAFT